MQQLRFPGSLVQLEKTELSRYDETKPRLQVHHVFPSSTFNLALQRIDNRDSGASCVLDKPEEAWIAPIGSRCARGLAPDCSTRATTTQFHLDKLGKHTCVKIVLQADLCTLRVRQYNFHMHKQDRLTFTGRLALFRSK